MERQRISRFSKYAWGVLFYNVLIILWGAFVRASGSGAGCGAHWPLCNGEIIPVAARLGTIIEFIHRVSSGLTVILIAVLIIWAWRKYDRRNPIRYSASMAGFFVITEALVGAGLVLFQMVAQNASIARAYWMIAHLENTLMLLAALILTAWWSLGHSPQGFSRHGAFGPLLFAGVLAAMILGASGAVAALGDTLFPVNSVAEGFRQDFSPSANILLRLRVFHPFIAVATALFAGSVAYGLRSRYNDPRVRMLTLALLGLLGLQITLGVINIALLAPIWMQLVHLLVSDLVWMTLVLLVAVVVGTVDLLPRLTDQKVHDRIHNPERVG